MKHLKTLGKVSAGLTGYYWRLWGRGKDKRQTDKVFTFVEMAVVVKDDWWKRIL